MTYEHLRGGKQRGLKSYTAVLAASFEALAISLGSIKIIKNRLINRYLITNQLNSLSRNRLYLIMSTTV